MAYISFQPSDYYNTVLYTGNGSSQNITGVGFDPDWIWTKCRSDADTHEIYDKVRGATKRIRSDSTAAENTESYQSFITDGFAWASSGNQNASSRTFVSWNWKANGSGSANSDGSISSTVSASTTSGFSIVKYTGNLTSGATIGHGLGVKPAMIIIKNLDAAESWLCYHTSLGATKHIKLNATEAAGTATSRFNDTEPTTSLFTVGNDPQTNGNSNDMIAYCFTEKKGFSKFGSYTGNGNADGAFIYTGFRPAFFLVKNTSATESWYIIDNKRPAYNTNNYYLLPNTSGAEGTSTSLATSLLSNGVKIENSDTSMNTSGQTYIYMAFAEHPLVSSNDIPATAR
jgi:hypothetical protein